MAIKSADQISIIDLTDGYSVILTSDGYTFPGTTNAAKAGSCTTQVVAMRGSEQIPASVTLSGIVKPTGITVTKDNDATSPTLTIAASTSFTTAGVVMIPIVLEDGSITINKSFAVSIAFTGSTGVKGDTGATGNGVASVAISYQASTSNTTAPTGTWQSSPPSVSAGQYLWTKMVFSYTDGTTSDPVYSVAKQGATGSAGTAGGKWYSGTGITGTSTTATIFSGSGVSSAVVGDMYLNTGTYNTYRCTTAGDAATAKWVYVNNIKGATGQKGDTGANGADAITMSITSSAGTIFKNTSVVTTLTAHVYKAGVEVTGSALAALGTIKWYKDGSTTALPTTGATLTISAGDVSSKATYIAQLEA